MTDLRALDDAFEELERRADAVTAARPFDLPRAPASRRAARLVPIALATAVVAGVATGAVLLRPDADPGAPAARPGASTSAPEPVVTTTPPAAHDSPEALAERFQAVLGDLATFVVTERGPGATRMTLPDSPNSPSPDLAPQKGTDVGASIGGTLTSAGVTGGFDLLLYPGTEGDQAWCAPDEPGCTVRDLPDGSKLRTGQVALEGSGMTHDVKLVRPNGLVLIVHVSNRESPKGLGPVLGAHPPLTVEQLVSIATSDRW